MTCYLSELICQIFQCSLAAREVRLVPRFRFFAYFISNSQVMLGQTRLKLEKFESEVA